ncbi:hypothetical protein [Actinokineospora globicatena]|uniref:hypothetical protein n=1 Tax=Actinokineospora globicatena TaxID=103729 RepID=UPI0020A53942|nr:hypothetical protein [Actinokineospora globicatena]MCP2306253.1 hypothetical protein [Actinokineospora globicatena]GLW81678.1 hypothetical protein Aglo01_61590 [Actinokineospora globicatena]GLW88473.1 hypothetical protein Aglo02_61120 [Actinokineospora globicatena]
MTDSVIDRPVPATAQLLYNYDHATTTSLDIAAYTATIQLSAIRVHGMPDLIFDRPEPDEVIHWVSIAPDGNLTRHETPSRYAFDPTPTEHAAPDTQSRWIQWPLIVALYSEALDPNGRCRDTHGYRPQALTFHDLGTLRGVVVEGCNACPSTPQHPNAVAVELVRAMGGPLLDLTGTIAWLGQWNDTEPGGLHGYDTLGDEEVGVLSGMAHALRHQHTGAAPGRSTQAGRR